MFDIPEERKQARDTISKKLKALGFYQMQKSVFVHYLPCEDEIDFIQDFFQVRGRVSCIEAKSLGNLEKETRRFFDLKP